MILDYLTVCRQRKHTSAESVQPLELNDYIALLINLLYLSDTLDRLAHCIFEHSVMYHTANCLGDGNCHPSYKAYK